MLGRFAQDNAMHVSNGEMADHNCSKMKLSVFPTVKSFLFLKSGTELTLDIENFAI